MTWVYVLIPVILAAAALGIALLRRRFAVVTVNGQSMLPTLANGDRVLVRRVALGNVRPGSVVVVEKPATDTSWPQTPARRVTGRDWLIKRAAAVPGDPLPDAFSSRWPALAGHLVPEGKLIVLGDNPAGSFDSRVIGYIPADRLLGVVARRMTGGSDGGSVDGPW